MTQEKTAIEQNPEWTSDDIEDVRVIYQVRGKHYSIVPLPEMDSKEAQQLRVEFGKMLLQFHQVVIPALEEMNADELRARIKNKNHE